MYIAGVVFLSVFFLATSPVQADILTLQSGESLSGEFSRIRSGMLVFRTSLQGQMMLPADRVKSLSTDSAFSIQMKDGGTIFGRFGLDQSRQVVLPPDQSPSIPVELRDIQETLPIPAPPQAPPEAVEPTLSHRLSDPLPLLFGIRDETGERLPGERSGFPREQGSLFLPKLGDTLQSRRYSDDAPDIRESLRELAVFDDCREDERIGGMLLSQDTILRGELFRLKVRPRLWELFQRDPFIQQAMPEGIHGAGEPEYVPPFAPPTPLKLRLFSDQLFPR